MHQAMQVKILGLSWWVLETNSSEGETCNLDQGL